MIFKETHLRNTFSYITVSTGIVTFLVYVENLSLLVLAPPLLLGARSSGKPSLGRQLLQTIYHREGCPLQCCQRCQLNNAPSWKFWKEPPKSSLNRICYKFKWSFEISAYTIRIFLLFSWQRLRSPQWIPCPQEMREKTDKVIELRKRQQFSKLYLLLILKLNGGKSQRVHLLTLLL